MAGTALTNLRSRTNNLTPENKGNGGTTPKIARSTSQKIELAKKVCILYSTGKYTLPQCCKYYAVNVAAFRRWSRPEADLDQLLLNGEDLPYDCIMEVHELYKAAKVNGTNIFMDTVRDQARLGLMKRVSGFQSQEITEELEMDKDGEMTVAKKKVKTFEVAPDPASIMFTLSNTDPTNFKNRYDVAHSGKIDTGKSGLENMTDLELRNKKIELQNHLAKLDAARQKR